MPKTALKEKPKRTADRSPFENFTTNQHAADDDIDMDETSSDEDDEDVPEKDEAEKKLERMLFGDDEGFLGALKSQQDRADTMQLTLHSDEESGSADESVEGDGEVDVGGIADEDVCDSLPLGHRAGLFQYEDQLLIWGSLSFFSLIPAMRLCLQT